MLSSESVNAALADAALVLSSKHWKIIQDGGQRRKINPKSLGFLLPCGNRCRFSESAVCSPRVQHPFENRIELKFKILRWRLRKVAFDIVQCLDGSFPVETALLCGIALERALSI